MSMPPDNKPAAAPAVKPSGKPGAPSAASRYLFLFLIGLVVGALAVVMILRSIEARKTWEDHYPEAAMTMMQAHMAKLKGSAEANRCGATDILPHIQALRMVSNDLEPAFGGLNEDQRFGKHASQLRAELDGVLAAPPLNCTGLVKATDKIGEACKACHQDFRN